MNVQKLAREIVKPTHPLAIMRGTDVSSTESKNSCSCFDEYYLSNSSGLAITVEALAVAKYLRIKLATFM